MVLSLSHSFLTNSNGSIPWLCADTEAIKFSAMEDFRVRVTPNQEKYTTNEQLHEIYEKYKRYELTVWLKTLSSNFDP